MKIFKHIYLNRDLIIIVILVVVTGVIIFNNAANLKTSSPSNYCQPYGVSGGSTAIKMYVSKSTNYEVWVHLESPVQINFNNNLPGTYNPLLIAVDNKNCYQAGANRVLNLNTWSWISYSNSTNPKLSRIYLAKGGHILTITSLFTSIDRVELLNSDCTPVADGSNCP